MDSSVGMMSIARQHLAQLQDQMAGQIRFVDGDMRSDLVGDTQFKLIFIAYNTFLHLISRDDQLSTLKNMYQMLSDDGRIIIDIFTPRHRDLSQYDYHRQELPIYRGVYQDELTGKTYVRNDRIKLDLVNQLQTVEFIYDKIGVRFCFIGFVFINLGVHIGCDNVESSLVISNGWCVDSPIF